MKEYDELSLVHGRPRPEPVPAPVPLTVPGRVLWGGAWVKRELVDGSALPTSPGRPSSTPAASRGESRCVVPGRAIVMRPLGAPGTRKLQDILVDLRVPAARSRLTPLVVCDDRVLWVCGLLVAEEGRITRETTGIVRLAVGRAGTVEPTDDTGGREGDG